MNIFHFSNVFEKTIENQLTIEVFAIIFQKDLVENI